ncbi:hypothetical protein DFS33DRAFT_1385557 [Desarmillaria ectypa]|nr:hypothetical protein DFS33DRAFT_1385557 [Desarmillaria ectypa]
MTSTRDPSVSNPRHLDALRSSGPYFFPQSKRRKKPRNAREIYVRLNSLLRLMVSSEGLLDVSFNGLDYLNGVRLSQPLFWQSQILPYDGLDRTTDSSQKVNGDLMEDIGRDSLEDSKAFHSESRLRSTVYNGKFVDAAIEDLCSGCGHNGIDLSSSAFEKLALLDDGCIKVTWNYD